MDAPQVQLQPRGGKTKMKTFLQSTEELFLQGELITEGIVTWEGNEHFISGDQITSVKT